MKPSKASNPFAEFAASAPTSTTKKPTLATLSAVRAVPQAPGGWLNTKKRGRDDQAIERDGMRVREARREARRKTPTLGPGGASKPSGRRRKKKPSSDESDEADDDAISWCSHPNSDAEAEGGSDGSHSGESLDNFIVNDDEILMKEEEGSSSPDEDATFVEKYPKRRSRPPPALRGLEKTAGHRGGRDYSPRSGKGVKSNGRTRNGIAGRARKSREEAEVLTVASDSDEIDERSGPPSLRRPAKPAAELHDEDEDVDVMNGEDSDKIDSPMFAKKTKSRFGAVQCRRVDEDSDDSSIEPPVFDHGGKRPRLRTDTQRIGIVEEKKDDDNAEKAGMTSPFFSRKKTRAFQGKEGRKTGGGRRRFIEEVDSDEEDCRRVVRDPCEGDSQASASDASYTPSQPTQKQETVVAEDSTDDDEVRLAKQLSLGKELKNGARALRERKPIKGATGISREDYVDDSEYTAIKMAMELSEREVATGESGDNNGWDQSPDVAAAKSKQMRRLGKMKNGLKRAVDCRSVNATTDSSVRKRKTEKGDLKSKKDTNRDGPSKKNAHRRIIPDIEESSEEEDLLKDDSSDPDDGAEEDEVDEYVEEAEREAGSVLAVANNLSAEVLRTMAGWCGGDEEGKGEGGSVPKGMIVDGALALSAPPIGARSGSEGDNGHEWISQDVMRRICPRLKLADYQLIGVNWLALLHGMRYRASGAEKKKGKRKKKGGDDKGTNVNGVLADEMGLGKTVQTIAFIAWLRNRNGRVALTGSADEISTERGASGVIGESVRPHIVIVPASVLSNWLREFETFCPDITVVKYHGTLKERESLRDRLHQSLPGRPKRLPLDVVLTTMSYFQKEKSDDRSFLRKFDFDYMIVDEGHCLKNPRGKMYRNMDKFKTLHRLLLTGTPVQNSPQELMSLLCFLMPLFSQPRSGGDDFDDEDNGNDGGAHMLDYFVTLESADTKRQLNGVIENPSEHAYQKLKQLFAPFVLRRRKVDVLGQLIPPKTRKVNFVPFDKATRHVYDSILSSHLKKRQGICTKKETVASQKHLFTALRKAANHPLLLRRRHMDVATVEHLSKYLFNFGYFGQDATCTQALVKEELSKFSDYDIHCAATELIDEDPPRSKILSRYTLKEDDLFCSPKCLRLQTLLPDLVQDGHRMLIFSQWTRCLDLLGCLMDSIGFQFLRLDGQTPIEERQRLIDKFNDDASIPVFLLSTRAGGMGINLTAADTCILHDLDFNPFNDLQAEDRCHRIGQKRPVTIIKLVTENTVDADIYKMQERKAKMNAAILENGSTSNGQKVEVSNGKKISTKEESKEISNMVQSAIDRLLSSPVSKKVS